jgi:hypothetical protein
MSNLGSACTNTSPAGVTTANEPLTFAQFNDPGFTLVDVTLQVYTFNYLNNLNVQNPATNSASVKLTEQNEVLLSLNSQGTNSNGSQDGSLANPFYDNIEGFPMKTVPVGGSIINGSEFANFGPSSPFTDATAAQDGVSSNTFDYAATGLNLSAFAGGGSTPSIYWQVLGTQTESGPSNYSATSSNYAGAYIELTYDYVPNGPTPEPASLLLLGSGLTALAYRLRHRRVAK